MKSKRAKNCRNLNSSEAVGTSSDIFGNVRKSSQIVGNLRKSLGRFQKSRSRQSKNLTHLTQKKLAGIKSTAHFLNNSFLFKVIILTSSETQGQSVGSGGATKVSFQFKAFASVLENFRRAFSPDPTDCSWVSEDVILICARRIFNASKCGSSQCFIWWRNRGVGGGLDETLLLMINILHLESPRCDLHRRYKLWSATSCV